MVFPSNENRSPEVIKAPIQFVPNLGQGFMNSSCNVQGTGSKYRNTFKRGVEMQKKTNFQYPIGRLQNEIGMNGPAIISIFRGKDPADLYSHLRKAWENLGEEVQEMINDFSSTTRKSEIIPFWRQKDLSYTPE